MADKLVEKNYKEFDFQPPGVLYEPDANGYVGVTSDRPQNSNVVDKPLNNDEDALEDDDE